MALHLTLLHILQTSMSVEHHPITNTEKGHKLRINSYVTIYTEEESPDVFSCKLTYTDDKHKRFFVGKHTTRFTKADFPKKFTKISTRILEMTKKIHDAEPVSVPRAEAEAAGLL